MDFQFRKFVVQRLAAVLLRIGIEVEVEFFAFQIRVRRHERARVVHRGVLEIDGDADVLCHEDALREGHITPIVVDDIISVQSPAQQHTVGIDALAARLHDDEAFPLRARELVRSLVALLRLELVAGKASARDGGTGVGGEFGVFQHVAGVADGGALKFFVVVHEVTLRARQFVIARDELAAVLAELHEDFVEFVQLRGVPFGLERNGIVGNGGEHLHAVAEFARHLQVEIGVQHQTLAVAETQSPREGAVVIQPIDAQRIVLHGVGIVRDADDGFGAVDFGARGVDAAVGVAEIEGEDAITESDGIARLCRDKSDAVVAH